MRKAIQLLILSITIGLISCQNIQKQNTQGVIYENSDQMVEAAKQVIAEISTADFKTLYDGEDYFVLIDVRTAEEYAAGYIPGAVNIDRGLLEFKIGKAEVWDEMGLYIPEKTDAIVVVCRSGNRSALAAKTLKEMGYENVKSLQGGWNAWHEANPELMEQLTVEEEIVHHEVPAVPKAAGGC